MSHRSTRTDILALILVSFCSVALAIPATAQQVIYKPYVELGDAGPLGASDQMVIAWQTGESSPNASAYRVEFGASTQYGAIVGPTGRVVDNYLSADPSLPVPATYKGPRVDYYAVLTGLRSGKTYFYRVTGPGLPAEGFASSFHTRTRDDEFSFAVEGDEGFFPTEPVTPARLADFEARIAHLINNADKIPLPGQPNRPKPDFALNTGDNVYNVGSEQTYRDFWFPVWNSDVDSNETGAPFIRSTPYFIVVGNHDVGGSGDFVNMLASDSAPEFSGSSEGGDMMAYFNNYYFPLNGPVGADSQQILNGDSSTPTGFLFQYKGIKYSSPAASEAFRQSTAVNSGQGSKRQIDHMANYSFDYGNAHYVFLDANPHVFNAQLDSTSTYSKPAQAFPNYPSILREWLIKDLDSSDQTWKFVVFHQPAFSSGNSTVRNFQMRGTAKFLEDHGVNMVFNGHEHNYQRTKPLRATANAASAPVSPGPAALELDTNFDGIHNTVPDGVLYLVEGAGGNRDFDDNLGTPRGNGTPNVDAEDSSTGTVTLSGFTFLNGPGSWLDTNLTNNEMTPLFPTAGTGPKITDRFKSKLFSFADILVRGNELTLYQISEPLLPSSSATHSNPAPFGTDWLGNPVNDPIPDTLIDPATGNVVSPPADGPSVLLDKFTVRKPEVEDSLSAKLSAPHSILAGQPLTWKLEIDNRSQYALNGTQVVLSLPTGTTYAGALNDTATLQGSELVITLGRLQEGEQQTVNIPAFTGGVRSGDHLMGKAIVRSSTAQPVESNAVITKVGSK